MNRNETEMNFDCKQQGFSLGNKDMQIEQNLVMVGRKE